MVAGELRSRRCRDPRPGRQGRAADHRRHQIRPSPGPPFRGGIAWNLKDVGVNPLSVAVREPPTMASLGAGLIAWVASAPPRFSADGAARQTRCPRGGAEASGKWRIIWLGELLDSGPVDFDHVVCDDSIYIDRFSSTWHSFPNGVRQPRQVASFGRLGPSPCGNQASTQFLCQSAANRVLRPQIPLPAGSEKSRQATDLQHTSDAERALFGAENAFFP